MPDDLRGRRILVVEDDFFLAEDLRQELVSRGAEVLGPVSSVSDALDLLATDAPPAAAVLDVKLGDKLVYPVADALEQRSIPFLFATAYSQWELPAAYAHVPHCEKPVTMPVLMQMLAGQ